MKALGSVCLFCTPRVLCCHLWFQTPSCITSPPGASPFPWVNAKLLHQCLPSAGSVIKTRGLFPFGAGSAAAPAQPNPTSGHREGQEHPRDTQTPSLPCLGTRTALPLSPCRAGVLGTGGSAQPSSAQLCCSPQTLLSPSNPPVMLQERLQLSPEFPQPLPWCKAIHQGTQTARLLKATP